jgi:hypothetical protein
MTDRVFATAGNWAVASDGIQWSLCYRCNDRGRVYWRPVSFVRSTKDVLARCMREKGVVADVARQLLAGLSSARCRRITAGRQATRQGFSSRWSWSDTASRSSDNIGTSSGERGLPGSRTTRTPRPGATPPIGLPWIGSAMMPPSPT